MTLIILGYSDVSVRVALIVRKWSSPDLAGIHGVVQQMAVLLLYIPPGLRSSLYAISRRCHTVHIAFASRLACPFLGINAMKCGLEEFSLVLCAEKMA